MRKQLLTLDHLVQLIDPKLYLHLQSADSTNFFFFFRMLLVWYKREFEWQDVLRLWEGLWTDYLSGNFHLFIALAILERHRDVIMDHLKAFDEVLKYINELSGTIDLQSTLVRAEGLFRRFQRTIEAVDRKNNNSSLPTPSNVRQRKSITTPPAFDFNPFGRIAALNAQRNGNAANGSATASGSSVAQGQIQDGKNKQNGVDVDDDRPKVISDELRELLSRKVPKLEKKQNTEGALHRAPSKGA